MPGTLVHARHPQHTPPILLIVGKGTNLGVGCDLCTSCMGFCVRDSHNRANQGAPMIAVIRQSYGYEE